MDTIRKLPASDGAEWLLGGFALLRRAPLALGALGALWGLLASLVMTVGLAVPALATILQLLVALAGPVLFAGLLWAVREVAHGRPAMPAHLLQGVREGRVAQLLTTLLPQLAAGLVLGVVAAIAVAMTVFVSVPRILFEHRDGLPSMRDSLRACLHNLPAMAVFLLLAMVAIFAIYFGVLLVTLVLQLVAGPVLAMWIAQLLLMAVLMPLLAGATYTAWTRLFGEPVAGASAPLQPGHLEA